MTRAMLLVTILLIFAGNAQEQQPVESSNCDASGPSTVYSRIAMDFLKLDAATFKAAGLCKLNQKELNTLMVSKLQIPNGCEPVRFTDKANPESMTHLHVSVTFEDGLPEVVQSDILGRLRSIPDVVIVHGDAEDVALYITGLPVKVNGKTVAVAWSGQVYRFWLYPPLKTGLEQNYPDGGFMLVTPLEDIDQKVQEVVAKMDMKVFEVLREERQSKKPN